MWDSGTNSTITSGYSGCTNTSCHITSSLCRDNEHSISKNNLRARTKYIMSFTQLPTLILHFYNYCKTQKNGSKAGGRAGLEVDVTCLAEVKNGETLDHKGCAFGQKRGPGNYLYRIDVYSLQPLGNGSETRECQAEPSSPASQEENLCTYFMSYVS